MAKKNREEDMMSKLPDKILVAIMCLLDTEEAARMSVVSKRWHKIWKYTIPITPRLTFVIKTKTRDSTNQKINAVDGVLKLHEAPTLDEFLLLIGSNVKPEQDCHHHIKTWLDFAAKKHVKKLTLQLDSDSDIGYHASFVAGKFHCLRELYIQGIHVTEKVIRRLFSNSPFLERFSLSMNPRQLEKLKLDSAPNNLNYLKIESCNNLRHLEISSSLPNLKTMEITSAVNLESLNISSAPNLSHLIIGIHYRGFKFDSYITLLNQIKRLTLHIDAPTNVIWAQLTQFPEFSKVEHLELKMASGSKIPIHRLPDILKAAPFLSTFSFQDYKLGHPAKGHPAKDNAKSWLRIHFLKKVKVNRNHSCQYLKEVKLDMFAGCQYEVEFLLYLLEYAVSVEKIIIRLMPSSNWRDRNFWSDYEDKFDKQYEKLCLGCAQLLKNKILQMYPRADVIIVSLTNMIENFSVRPKKYMLKRLMMMKKVKKRLTMPKRRKKRRLKDEDLISKLPDEILVSIMCWLNTEEAARMSVVSRRWHKIWKTTIQITPRLSFNVQKGWYLAQKNSLEAARDLIKKRINEFNAVLKLHKAPTLHEFSLIGSRLRTEEDSHHINTWMDFAAKKHVKKLTLDYDPTFLADNFHCLRELNMVGVDVTENFIHRLFSYSPFLERFSLSYSTKLRRLSIVSAPNLNYLYLERCSFLRLLEISSANNLNTLEIRGGLTLQSINISSGSPNLSHLILDFHLLRFDVDSYLTLLNHQIKTLTLHIEGSTDQISAQFPRFPEFSKVERLELKMSSGTKIPIYRLPDILMPVPFLNTFSFQISVPFLNTFSFQHCQIGHPAKDNALKWLDMHIPKKVEVNQNHPCQYLKVVKFDIFAGCQYEVEFLLHLLEYAVSVEKIMIQLMPSSKWRDRKFWSDYEDKFDNQYKKLCFKCALKLKTRILQMHPSANVIIT